MDKKKQIELLEDYRSGNNVTSFDPEIRSIIKNHKKLINKSKENPDLTYAEIGLRWGLDY